MTMITAYGLEIRWCRYLARLAARILLLCYGESIGTTGLFPPRKVVESVVQHDMGAVSV